MSGAPPTAHSVQVAPLSKLIFPVVRTCLKLGVTYKKKATLDNIPTSLLLGVSDTRSRMRVLKGTRRTEHVSPMLVSLHQLPVKSRKI